MREKITGINNCTICVSRPAQPTFSAWNVNNSKTQNGYHFWSTDHTSVTIISVFFFSLFRSFHTRTSRSFVRNKYTLSKPMSEQTFLVCISVINNLIINRTDGIAALHPASISESLVCSSHNVGRRRRRRHYLICVRHRIASHRSLLLLHFDEIFLGHYIWYPFPWIFPFNFAHTLKLITRTNNNKYMRYARRPEYACLNNNDSCMNAHRTHTQAATCYNWLSATISLPCEGIVRPDIDFIPIGIL